MLNYFYYGVLFSKYQILTLQVKLSRFVQKIQNGILCSLVDIKSLIGVDCNYTVTIKSKKNYGLYCAIYLHLNLHGIILILFSRLASNNNVQVFLCVNFYCLIYLKDLGLITQKGAIKSCPLAFYPHKRSTQKFV